MKLQRVVLIAVGLTLGFVLSFFWTRGYNKTAAGSASAGGGMPAAGDPSGAGGPGGPGQAGMMANVKETLEKAKNNPNDFEAQFEAARMYFQVGRQKEAIEYLTRAYNINPKNIVASANIANVYFEQKDYLQAEKWYRTALTIEPNEPDLLAELGATFILREPPVPDQALPPLQSALKIKPTDSHALFHLAEAYLELKDAKGAEATLDRIKQAEPNSQFLPMLQPQLDNLKGGKAVVIPKE